MSAHVAAADASAMRSPDRTDPIESSRCGEEGQTAAEYAVVLGVITPIIALAFLTLGNSIAPIIDKVTSYL
jgi:Flp pilus assembly pilin Flp